MSTAAAIADATYSRIKGEPISWEGYSVSEDHKVETQRLTDKRMAWFAALQVQDLAKTNLRGEEPVEEWTDAQGNAAFPTTQEFLEGILLEVVSQLKWQRRPGFHEQQQELLKLMDPVVIAWTLEEKRSEKISANKTTGVTGRLEKGAEAAEPETPFNRPHRYRHSSHWQRSRWPSCRHRNKLAEMSTKR